MTSNEFKEVVDILAEYAQTGMMCIDEQQKKLIKNFFEIMDNENRQEQPDGLRV